MLTTNRRTFLAGAGAAAILASASAGAPAFGQQRRELRIGVNGLPKSLEPVNAINNTGVRIINQIYDTLLGRDWFGGGAPGNGIGIVPGLAESWERVDEHSVRFKMREGVLFHHGEELTAEDVAYTFSSERLWGPDASKTIPLGPAYSLDFDEPIVEGKYTVIIRTKTPSPLIEAHAASWMGRIIPKGRYQELGPIEFGNQPVGTGPYKFAEFISGDRVVLEANENYWGPAPAASRITFQVVAEPATRVAGLISGEYDIVTTLTPDDMALINSYPDLETRGSVIENFHMFSFNMHQPILKEKSFRRALALAVNRPLLVEALWKNLAAIPNGFNFPHYGATYDPNRRPFEYDIEEAKRLVKESGYDGRPITYRTQGNYYANAVPALMMMIEMWKEIGVTIVPEIYATGTSVPDEQNWIRNWSNGQWTTDAYASIVPEFGPTGQVQQRWGWEAPAEFNDLCQKVMELPDGPERFDAFNRLRDIFEEEAPAVILYQPYDVYGARKDVLWEPVSFEMMEFRNNLTFA